MGACSSVGELERTGAVAEKRDGDCVSAVALGIGKPSGAVEARDFTVVVVRAVAPRTLR